ncbi:type I phosphomannose isomerase catalytic subunit [[Clostridium] aminophilum]|uniref:Phosphohexomutase n=1 Tax=[Clostridium] aminophilum TaxID=1526 RepID=A0A1I6J5P2_9FIRM|nr:type I phosphomannose isomerase catalytic subunit [[Clostridium] aminophilum]SFR74258.1 mannose-6-phosphate isomerase [[Clostridium] aminophilum]
MMQMAGRKTLLFMKPFLKEVLWGGTALRDRFGYDIPGDHTGEAWVISGHPAGPSVVADGEYAGMTLAELWREHGELFGRKKEEPEREHDDSFPLLIKLIDAGDDLSIQVHPDDIYAREHENGSRGKTECWYVVDCREDADIIIGHHARSKEELKRMIAEKRWSDLLCVRPVKKGDFFYIPSGTVHAIRKGTILLEVQQSCDLTYRLYDYDRLQNGKPRELHLEKAEDVITCPQSLTETRQSPVHIPGGERQILVDSETFTVEKWTIRTKHETDAVDTADETDDADKIEAAEETGAADKTDAVDETVAADKTDDADEVRIADEKWKNNDSFLLCDIIEGTGRICGRGVKAGDHFIVPSGFGDLAASGDMTMIVSYV